MTRLSRKGMQETAEKVLQAAWKAGADQALVKLSVSDFVEAGFRDGTLEKAASSTKLSLNLALYINKRYAVHNTSDLRPDALGSFVKNAAGMTALLEPDQNRGLPDPELYAKPPGPDLGLYDPALAASQPESWIEAARELEALAREGAQDKNGSLVSSQGGAYQETAREFLATSEGFSGFMEETGAFRGASVVLLDHKEKQKRRSGSWWEGGRTLEDVADPEGALRITDIAAQKALDQMGARPGPTGRFPVLVENQAAGKLVGQLISALSGASLYQKRSYLAGMMELDVASPVLTLEDRPLLEGGLASRWFDGEGMEANPITLIESGVLKDYYLDTYHSRALEMPVTTGSRSNVMLAPSGEAGLEQLMAQMQEGLLVTGFLGGNFNSTTGDFSYGLTGRWIEDGRVKFAVEGMNLSGNAMELWKSLETVGSDPFKYSSLMAPSLLFRDAQLSGE